MEQRQDAQEFMRAFELCMFDRQMTSLERFPYGVIITPLSEPLVPLVYISTHMSSHAAFLREMRRDRGRRHLGELVQVDNLQVLILHLVRQLRDGDDGIDVAIGQNMGDLFFAQKGI